MAVLYSQQHPLGWPAPDFNLPDAQRKTHKLADFSKQGLLILFTCNHCPYAQAAWPTLVELHHDFKQNIDFVAINANDSADYPQDSVEGMQDLIIQHKVGFPYLIDESQQVAKAFNAVCTPDPFLFKNVGDGKFELQYHGRINDNWQYPDAVTEHSLRLSMEHLVADRDPLADQKPSMGCSIKWKQA